ncbi:hypothetical protein FHS85_000882 [Rhodoligotrophos appendicifer]|uniref:hypothetical protein n=1 Tax=Rhodoligotrophos appendicifer TaxID=987056 RepID=UPI00117C4F9C|nr:hypothetical protein [Rhodoligotrophos appendicifer]
MTRTLTALFDDFAEARTTVAELEASGIPHSDISIVANNAGNRHSEHHHGEHHHSEAAEDAGKGAGIGGVLGGGAGLLAGLGLLAVPGLGPVVAAGWLAATATGAIAGAIAGGAAGGIVGALTESGVDEDRAHVYAEGVRRGGTLVTVRTDEAHAATAEAILNRDTVIDPDVRGRAYREQGWTGFDESAPAYTHEEIERERSIYSPTPRL